MTEIPPRAHWKLRVLLLLGIAAMLGLLKIWSPAIILSQDRLSTMNMMSAMDSACHAYVTENGSLPPSVDNRALVGALTGANARRVVYLRLRSAEKNSQNEAVDAWGTPYRVSYASPTGVDIVSAGSDKVFGTDDDIGN